MNEVFKTFLSLSFSGSLLILAFLLCRPLLRDRVSRQWQYYIWLLVIARLLLPYAPQTNFTNSFFQTVNKTVEIPKAAELQQQNRIDLSDSTSRENDYGIMNQKQTPGAWLTANEAWRLVKSNLWLLWLAGAFVLFIRKATAYESFVRFPVHCYP